jgi:uncharacterized protein (DUF924 family)
MNEHFHILDFWFNELTEEQWFSGGDTVDELIRKRFSETHRAVAQNECAHWRETADGALAEILVLDQFSRNIYRGSATAFACDGQALALAQVAIARGFDTEVEKGRAFFYLPYMHSESKVIHQTAVELFSALENAEHLKYEYMHKEIIDQFGRYPHRNELLGRTTTAEEGAFLAEADYSFFKV